MRGEVLGVKKLESESGEKWLNQGPLKMKPPKEGTHARIRTYL